VPDREREQRFFSPAFFDAFTQDVEPEQAAEHQQNSKNEIDEPQV
jgi:hypothetical protein